MARLFHVCFLITLVSALICGCQPAPTPVVTDTPSPEITQTLAPENREQVTLADVTNVEPSLLLGSGEAEAVNYPENSTDTLKKDITERYQAIQRRFGKAQVLFNQDTEPDGSAHWVEYPVIDGKLIHATYAYGGALTPSLPQPFDYPVRYERNAAGVLEVVGDYEEMEIPEGSVGMTWTGLTPATRLPQFVAGSEITLADGRKVYPMEMNYKSFVENGDYWQEIPEVAALVNEENANKMAISAQELMADKLNPLVIETSLEGTVSLAGKDVELNYPELKAKITFAFDKSIMERSLEETGFLPYRHAALNPEYMEKIGTDEEGAEREIATHILFMNYLAWQRDDDGQFFNQRKNTLFTEWLDRLDKGEDVGYHMWFYTENGKGYANKRIYVDPHQFLNLDVYFTVNSNNPGEILGHSELPGSTTLVEGKDMYRYFYDEGSQKIVLAVNVLPYSDIERNYSGLGYADLLGVLQTLSLHGDAQRSGWQFINVINPDISEVMESVRPVIYDPLCWNYPLIVFP